MNIKVLFAFLLIASFVYGQSEKHVKIGGTKCSIIPPPSFTASKTFSGFQHEGKGASIMITELPGSYKLLIAGMTKDALKAKGMDLINSETIDLNNSKAVLLHLTQSANGATYQKQMLIFGDEQTSVLVNGIYPEASKDLAPEIRKSVLSIVYNSNQNTNALDAVAFSINTKNTDFKLIQALSGSLIYTTDGKMPTTGASLIIGNSLGQAPVLDQKKYAEARLRNLPRGDKTVIREISQVNIDKLSGYEIIADGKSKDDQPELVYQVMLFTPENGYYLIIGQTKNNFEKNLESFKTISKTFQRK